MADERSPEQQAGGLTEQPIGPQNLVADELVDNSQQVSSLEVTTPEDSSEEVTTLDDSSEISLVVSPGDGSTPEVPSDEVVPAEISLEDNAVQSEPVIETLPDEEICNFCDPNDPYGLKSDPGCDLPLCKPEPEDQEMLAEGLPLSSQEPLEEESKTPENSLGAQEGEDLEEAKDFGDPCATPEEPVCDLPKSALEERKNEMTDNELEGQETVIDDLTEGGASSSPEGTSEDLPEKPESHEEEPFVEEPGVEEEVKVVVDPCGPKDPCGFQIDSACITSVCDDTNSSSENQGEPQNDKDCTNPVEPAEEPQNSETT